MALSVWEFSTSLVASYSGECRHESHKLVRNIKFKARKIAPYLLVNLKDFFILNRSIAL